jgi:hypothetical protein
MRRPATVEQVLSDLRHRLDVGELEQSVGERPLEPLAVGLGNPAQRFCDSDPCVLMPPQQVLQRRADVDELGAQFCLLRRCRRQGIEHRRMGLLGLAPGSQPERKRCEQARAATVVPVRKQAERGDCRPRTEAGGARRRTSGRWLPARSRATPPRRRGGLRSTPRRSDGHSAQRDGLEPRGRRRPPSAPRSPAREPQPGSRAAPTHRSPCAPVDGGR